MFNIIHTYYNEKNFLTRQLENYQQCSDYYNKIIIVDDGSRMPAEPIVKEYDIDIDLYRVTKDIGFNSHGCRNLAMNETKSDWNLLMDIDWTIDTDTIKKIDSFIRNGNPEKQKVYTFIHSIDDKEAINVFLIHKETFWKARGYDEELVNIHTGDDLFYESLRDSGAILSPTSWEVTSLRKGRSIIFSGTDIVYDTDITVYDDKNMLLYQPGTSNHWNEMRERVSQRNKSKGLKPTLTFSWEKII